MSQIEVTHDRSDDDPMRFRVVVSESGSESDHEVTLARSDYDSWGGRSESPEQFVRRCFEFLLEREPKESILSRFDVRQITQYFPEFERQIRGAS